MGDDDDEAGGRRQQHQRERTDHQRDAHHRDADAQHARQHRTPQLVDLRQDGGELGIRTVIQRVPVRHRRQPRRITPASTRFAD